MKKIETVSQQPRKREEDSVEEDQFLTLEPARFPSNPAKWHIPYPNVLFVP